MNLIEKDTCPTTDYCMIPLLRGEIALVDSDDYDRIMQYRWFYWKVPNHSAVYARHCRNIDGIPTSILLHRFVLDAPVGHPIDHINGNGLDNRKTNLRLVTHSENAMNRSISVRNKSGYVGVNQRSDNGMWRAYVSINGRHINVGHFSNPIDAAQARDDKARELYGEFGRYNFPVAGERSAI